MDFISEKFSTRAKNALLSAQRISRELRHPQISTEHLLYGIVSELSSFASEVLLKNRISNEVVKDKLVILNRDQIVQIWQPKLSADLRQTLDAAATIASRYQYQFIGTEHLLYGLVTPTNNGAQKILKSLNINIAETKKNLVSIFDNVSKFPEPAKLPIPMKDFDESYAVSQESTLEYFTIDLTKKAEAGEIDPLIGREKEVERLVSILGRRTKNNPVLIGEPGVGKTAIVEGLALAICAGRVPDLLRNKRLLNLDLALMVAGSVYRGEFEQRLKQAIEEIKEQEDVILFIDELHTVIGAGAAQGALDAANILKPALARGELRAIGATTLTEYKQHIEQDPALERRFQPILVREPSRKDSLQILRGLRPYYESHHDVKISDEAIAQAVELSSRFLPDRFLPDKAIDLIDETAAWQRMLTQTKNQASSKLRTLEQNLNDIGKQKDQAVFSHNFESALHLQKKEQRLQKARSRMLSRRQGGESPVEISGTHIAQTVTRITGIPAERLVRHEAKRLLNLEKRLKQKVVGQPEALATIAAAIRRARAGIARATRPQGSFMFLGPSGVGKTLTAKVLAQEVFSDDQALIRIDMSEFMERHQIARLVGAPAGYVGYGEGGKLTEAVRRQPYSVLLFDEIEKAHPDVFHLLLQILEEGELTDAAGKKVSFRNTVLIMTSNLGLGELHRWAKAFGFSSQTGNPQLKAPEIKDDVIKQIERHFRPEFLNRLDKIIVFNPLSPKEIKQIVRLELKALKAQLLRQQIKVVLSPKIISYLTEISLDPKQGARFVRKNIQEHLEDPIAEALLLGRIKRKSPAKLKLKNKKIEVTN